jgi:hypothetical protein
MGQLNAKNDSGHEFDSGVGLFGDPYCLRLINKWDSSKID